MEFQENPSTMNSAVTCGQTDRQTKEQRIDGRRDMTRLTFASDSFVNAPHKIQDLINPYRTNVENRVSS